MKNVLTILSLIMIVSCKKENLKTTKKKSSEDSIINKSISINRIDSIETIDDIKKEYANINNLLTLKKLDSSQFSYNCDEREGEVTLYYRDKKLAAVKDFYAEHSHFSSSTTYFVKNDRVFFIFNDETVWNFDEGGTPEKPETKDDIKEKRIYILDNKAVQCFEKNYSIRSKGNNKNPENISNQKTKCTATEFIKRYELILKNKDTKGEIQCL
ncbi:hypothetical protein [Chryseobacterium profundimaris]|uniref:Lipoprotein n=1 Tax=Chryseobacterium profundimaris TaxID=1387275 RepID=A0ABY1P7I6_9FLAO|nr:hypothetical protein [Chryseobacterium profundimaris]SMP28138.1 hypothetical protein SAMN06264346_110110 [Chryseobacterium profundimaris]